MLSCCSYLTLPPPHPHSFKNKIEEYKYYKFKEEKKQQHMLQCYSGVFSTGYPFSSLYRGHHYPWRMFEEENPPFVPCALCLVVVRMWIRLSFGISIYLSHPPYSHGNVHTQLRATTSHVHATLTWPYLQNDSKGYDTICSFSEEGKWNGTSCSSYPIP